MKRLFKTKAQKIEETMERIKEGYEVMALLTRTIEELNKYGDNWNQVPKLEQRREEISYEIFKLNVKIIKLEK